MTPSDIAARARDWAFWLTEQPSITGSDGERDLPGKLAERMRAVSYLAGAEVWLLPAGTDGGTRSCLLALVRGEGPETILLTGHFDTVGIDDYQELRAGDPADRAARSFA